MIHPKIINTKKAVIIFNEQKNLMIDSILLIFFVPFCSFNHL